MSESHVCVLDKYGTCDDPNRDYCGKCERCTPWQGDVCDGCNGVWGVTA